MKITLTPIKDDSLTGNHPGLDSYQVIALQRDKFLGGAVIEWFGRGDILWIDLLAVVLVAAEE